MYVAGYDGGVGLAGFNPLKAIGRALGGVGRAVVGAVPFVGSAVSSALDTAAHQAADTPPQTQAMQQAIALQAGASTGAIVNATGNTGTLPATVPPQAPNSNDAMTAALIASLMKQNAPMPPAGQPAPNINFGGGYPGVAPAAGQPLPSWALPALLGLGGILAVSMLNKGK